MSFIRSFNQKQISALSSDKNIGLFNLLKNDVHTGTVFPAIRKNQLYFYYEGGCLYKFSNGTFARDAAFEKYSTGTEWLSDYDRAKQQNKNKFTGTAGSCKERRLLNGLYSYTFTNNGCRTVVLDIEINLNGYASRGKKCDLLLYNTQSNALAFVEGKVFSDSRVSVKCGSLPKVINQVRAYSAAINEQAQTIIAQYANHIRIINELFGTEYRPPEKLIRPAKLLVYETPSTLSENNRHSIKTITDALGKSNILMLGQNQRPMPDDIWEYLCK